MTKTREQILDDIDDATVPDKMSWQEAIQFLEELSSDLAGRIETLREENE
jgi:hypothetical protein